jgi:hypothetical protein
MVCGPGVERNVRRESCWLNGKAKQRLRHTGLEACRRKEEVGLASIVVTHYDLEKH